MPINIDVAVPDMLTATALILIEDLKDKNKLDFELTLMYDWSLSKAFGIYYPDKKSTIYINPEKIHTADEKDYGTFSTGFIRDLTAFGIVIHEFCHMAQYELFPKLLDDYKNTWPTKRFYLNDYSSMNLDDEIAEGMTLYIANPLLLKLISIEHFKFFRKYFKSPTRCSHKQCHDYYRHFDVEARHELRDRFNIVYNVHDEKFIRNK